MCRNIRVLHNYEPPATEEEIRAAALQYVRKISGGSKPAKANVEAFEWAVEEVTRITEALLAKLVAARTLPAAARRLRDGAVPLRERVQALEQGHQFADAGVTNIHALTMTGTAQRIERLTGCSTSC